MSLKQGSDVLPPFLATKLEQSRLIGALPDPGGLRSKPAEDNKRSDVELSKDLLLRDLIGGSKLNFRQKEHIAHDILNGKKEVAVHSAAPVPIQLRHVSPLDGDVINATANQKRHTHKHRSFGLVAQAVDITVQSAAELREKDIFRKRNSAPVGPGFTWANEFVDPQMPARVNRTQVFELRPSVNRDYIVQETKKYHKDKAKRSAEQVRTLKSIASSEKMHVGDQKLNQVAIRKKLNAFKRKLYEHLKRKGDKQRGEIMRCVDEAAIYWFMENFRGYSLSVEVIISLLGASLGPGAEVDIAGGPEEPGYLPVQSAHEMLSPHLRMLFSGSAEGDADQQQQMFLTAVGETQKIPLKSPKTSSVVNGFKVIPRASSRMGSGFMAPNRHSELFAPIDAEAELQRRAKSNYLFVDGTSALSPSNRADRGGTLSPIAAGALSSGESDAPSHQQLHNRSISDSEPRAAVQPSQQVILVEDLNMTDATPPVTASGYPIGDLEPIMKKHVDDSRLRSALPDKILTDEELLGLGNRTLSFEDIFKTKKKEEYLTKKQRGKPLTGLAGLGRLQASKAEAVHIPRFLRTAKAEEGRDGGYPKSPSALQELSGFNNIAVDNSSRNN